MGNWIIVDPLETSYNLPESPGCYAIYCEGRLVYIGQSTNLRKRFKQHGINFSHYSTVIVTPWGRFKTLQMKIRKSKRYGDWAMHELRLIKRLQPMFNCVGSVRKRGRNA